MSHSDKSLREFFWEGPRKPLPIAAPMQEDRELRPEEVAPGLWEDDELSEEEKDRLLWALANELRRLDLN